MFFERLLEIKTHTLGERHQDTILIQSIVILVGNKVSGQESSVGSPGIKPHARGVDLPPNAHSKGENTCFEYCVPHCRWHIHSGRGVEGSARTNGG